MVAGPQWLSALPFIALAACQPSPVSSPSSGAQAAPAAMAAAADHKLDEAFDLRTGEAATVAGAVTLKFEGVADDSRCPVGVTCVWEGDAVVRLAASQTGPSEALELHTHASHPRERNYARFRVQLLRLSPQPVGDRRVEQRDYVANLVVSRIKD
jgi:hypothetical protein